MKPQSIPELQTIVQETPRLLAYGGRSKTGLAIQEEGLAQVDMAGLAGMLEYQPEEYVFTALAGTRLDEVAGSLAEHGQYLPFDPPLGERGATLGGTVAAGLSGPGRYRYGGVRDFILGVQFIDGRGELVRGGGKVVKNAAGFDLPKLMVGSLGQFGPLAALSFKVFPRPAAYTTVKSDYSEFSTALEALIRLSCAPLDLYALDLAPNQGRARLLARLGGPPASFPARQERLRDLMGGGEILVGEAEAAEWQAAVEFRWVPEGSALIKVPLTPRQAPAVESLLAGQGAHRRYSVGANLAWVAWPGPLEKMDTLLMECGLGGLVVLGPGGTAQLGVRGDNLFIQRVKQALDPQGKFYP